MPLPRVRRGARPDEEEAGSGAAEAPKAQKAGPAERAPGSPVPAGGARVRRVSSFDAARGAQVPVQKRLEIALVPVGHRCLGPRPHVPHVAHRLHRYVVPRSELGSRRVARDARLLPRENVDGSLCVERPWRLKCVMLVPGQCHAWVGGDGYGGARFRRG